MRLVIDLQGAQSDSRNRGIGRYSRALAVAMAEQAGQHELLVMLNGNFRDATEELRDALAPVLPASHVRVWHGPGRQTSWQAADAGRRRAAERIRAAFLASLQPDVLLIASTFEGYGDEAVTGFPADMVPPPTVSLCYDLIPLSRPELYLHSRVQQDWYYPRLMQLAHSDALLCISQSGRDEILAGLGVDAAKVFNILAGVGELFRPAAPEDEPQDALLGRYGLQPGYVLCVGAVEERKNLAGLIRAYALLPPALRQQHQLVATCWNDGHQLPLLHRMVSDAGLAEDDVRLLTGFVSDRDLPGLYRGSAATVCPSFHEGFGLSVAEAMACGAAVLCSNASSLPEVMDHPDALFDPKDPAALAKRLRAVLDFPALAQELGRYGVARSARFTWASTASRAWAAAETLARPPAKTDCKLRLYVLAPLRGNVAPLRRLLQGLARWYAVTLLSDDPESDDPALRACFPLRTAAALAAQPPDRLVYWPGDDAAHAALTVRMLDAHPGVVIGNTLPFAILLQGAPGAWSDVLSSIMLELHGWHAAVAMQEDGAAAARYPIEAGLAQRAIRWLTEPVLDPGELHDLIEQAYASSPQAALERCLLGLASEDAATPEVAKAVAATFRRPGSRLLLLDVSTIAAYDAGTGIQRVVRETVRQLGRMADLGARVEPVSIGLAGLTLARGFGQRLFGLPPADGVPEAAVPADGDVFVGLDLHIHDVGGLAETIHAVRARGARAVIVIYDLLPVQMPACFPLPVQSMFPHWLRTISSLADGLLCISRAVADDLLGWLDAHPPTRTRPLDVGWFHLGADFRPAPGLAADHACLAAAATRPTALVVGTLEPRKGHVDALAAFDALWGEGVDVGLTLLGRTGWLMQGLEQRILAHPELGRRLHWVQDADDGLVAALYERSAVLLMASEGEGFGLPLVEAARAGLAVVCRDLPIFREVCGENAVYFTGGAMPLAAALRRWLALRKAGRVPDPARITTISWEESSRRLARIVLHDEWYARWTPQQGPCA